MGRGKKNNIVTVVRKGTWNVEQGKDGGLEHRQQQEMEGRTEPCSKKLYVIAEKSRENTEEGKERVQI